MFVTARPPQRRGCRGFTFVELLVAMMIGAGVAATAGWFLRTQFLVMEDQAAQLDIQTATRAVVDVFARDVRRAGMNPTCGNTVATLVDASTTTIRFQSDLNANGALDADSEDLRYRLASGTRIERTQGSSVEPLLDGVDLTGSRLRYFDSAGTEIVTTGSLTAAQLAMVRRIRLELAVRQPTRSGSGGRDLISRAATDVELRNRYFAGVAGCS